MEKPKQQTPKEKMMAFRKSLKEVLGEEREAKLEKWRKLNRLRILKLIRYVKNFGSKVKEDKVDLEKIKGEN